MPSALNSEEISRLDFSSIVALTNEPNTPSGAHESIRIILSAIPTSRIRRVLDVGCNTGFATLELASWLNADVVGIDLNEQSILLARERAAQAGLSHVKFEQGNLLEMPFDAATFDLVYCNNVTSFVQNRFAAISEYTRVLRPMGVLAAIPIYYRQIPTAAIVRAVSEAIGAPIEARGIEQWLECFSAPGLDLIFRQDFVYDRISSGRIAEYATGVTAPDRTMWLNEVQRKAVRERLETLYSLFDENLAFCGFSVLLYRWRGPNPMNILHTSRPAVGP
jgi:SAM-dependent methyltransferase